MPQNAILDGVVEKKFEKMVKIWAARWFGDQNSFSVSLRAAEIGEVIEESTIAWNNETEDITFILKMSHVAVFAQKLLNCYSPNNHISSTDARLFEHICKECIEDLQNGLRKDLLLSGSFSDSAEDFVPTLKPSDHLLCIKSLDNSVELKIVLPRSYLSAVRKVSLVPDTSEPNFGMMEDAIGEQVVSLGARVGTAAINLLDVEHLSKGDVLILDNNITDPINVTINKSVIAGLNCHIVQDVKTDNLKIVKIMMDEV